MIDAVAQALDLCLACKGCKAECPSGVDMAKLNDAVGRGVRAFGMTQDQIDTAVPALVEALLSRTSEATD